MKNMKKVCCIQELWGKTLIEHCVTYLDNQSEKIKTYRFLYHSYTMPAKTYYWNNKKEYYINGINYNYNNWKILLRKIKLKRLTK